MRGDLRSEIEIDVTADGPVWRGVLLDADRHVIDSTRSVRSPARATRDLHLLVTGRYWVHDGGDDHREWTHAA